MNEVIAVKAPLSEIVEFNEFGAQLLELEEDYGRRVYDLTDPIQEEAARSDRLKVAKTQTAFKKVRLAVKEKAQNIVNSTNKSGKIIDDRMEAVKQNIKGQLDKRDQELKEHAEELQARVDDLSSLAVFDCVEPVESVSIKDRLELAKSLVIDDSYEDRKADATLAQVDAIKALEVLLSERITFEDEQAELEKLRKEKEDRERAERDEKIRKEATEKATREAEQKAEREKQDAKRKADAEIGKAERAKEEAEEVAKVAEDAAREKLIQERVLRSVRERAERQKIENEKADKDHRKIVEERAIESFFQCSDGIDRKKATFIVMVIADGMIEGVSINY